MMSNCKNCGAVLTQVDDVLKCEYCNSIYEYIPKVDDIRQIIKINIGGTIRKFYIYMVEAEQPTTCYTTLASESYKTYITNRPILTLTLQSLD